MNHTIPTKFIGHFAEKTACEYLRQFGLQLLEQNYRCPFGEIDLIMQEHHTLVFIEVRSRHTDLEMAIESIDFSKQQKIIKSATYYLQKKRYYDKLNCRFDVIGINQSDIKWIKDAFYADNF